MRRLVPAILAAMVSLAGCGGTTSTQGPGPDPITASSQPSLSTGTGSPASTEPTVLGIIASGLAVPWGIAFLPDGSALVTERDSGWVLHVTRGYGPSSGVVPGGAPSITPRYKVAGRINTTGTPGGEAGLLGVAVSPSYRTDHRVFFYTSTATDNRILRATYQHNRLTDETPILTGIPRGVIHDGGRLAFGPDGALYASTGETGQGELAQDPTSLAGKILRITQDGQLAPGNPNPSSPVWTLGHRNVQGLAFDAQGRLWASEFGAQTWDELNLIRPGDNYGWPVVEGRSTLSKYRNPVVVWHTDQASPSGLAYADGSLWLGALRGERLWQVPVHGTTVGTPRDWFIGKYGRMRTVVRAPDGNLWVTTSNRDGRGSPAAQDDRILLVRP